MSRSRRDFCALGLSLLVGGALPGRETARAAAPPEASADADEGVPPARTLTTLFSFTATIPAVVTGAKTVDAWIPIPADNVYQSIRGLSVLTPYPYQMTREGRFGNQMVYLRVDADKTPLIVNISFVAIRKPVRLVADNVAISPVTVAFSASQARMRDALVPVGGKYRTLAQSIVGDAPDTMGRMRALYDHVVHKFEYDYRHVSPALGKGDAAFVCDYKKGNCTDLHSYLIALARSLDIPCFLEFGFPVDSIPFADPPLTEGHVDGYHCWLWFQDPKRGWLPLDAADGRRWADAFRPAVTEYLFGDLVTERSAVAVSRGRDLMLEPRQQGDPLNYFIYPYVEADGVPIAADWKLNFTRPQPRPVEKTDKKA